MDIGASTGGFTDCMLQNGAKRCIPLMSATVSLLGSFATIHGRQKPELTNMRKVTRSSASHESIFSRSDVSFISLKLILPVARELMSETHRLSA